MGMRALSGSSSTLVYFNSMHALSKKFHLNSKMFCSSNHWSYSKSIFTNKSIVARSSKLDPMLVCFYVFFCQKLPCLGYITYQPVHTELIRHEKLKVFCTVSMTFVGQILSLDTIRDPYYSYVFTGNSMALFELLGDSYRFQY